MEIRKSSLAKAPADVDWIEIETDFRLGASSEELAVQYGVPVARIDEKASLESWYFDSDQEYLHPKYLHFVNEYMKDESTTGVAERIGVTPAVARNILKRPEVYRLITKRRVEARVRSNVTQDTVLASLLKIANFDMRKLYDAEGHLLPVTALDDDTAFALASWEGETLNKSAQDGQGGMLTTRTTKCKPYSKLNALQDIGKHLGMFIDRAEVTGKDGAPLEVKEVNSNDAARRVAFILMQAAQLQKKETP